MDKLVKKLGIVLLMIIIINLININIYAVENKKSTTTNPKITVILVNGKEQKNGDEITVDSDTVEVRAKVNDWYTKVNGTSITRNKSVCKRRKKYHCSNWEIRGICYGVCE